MAKTDAIVWTPQMDAMIGTESDAAVGRKLNLHESRVRYRRLRLGLPSYRSATGVVQMNCATCGKPIQRRMRDYRRSKKLYCSKECANSGQKRRDAETLRYGPGWKNRRAEVRRRDRVCRACGMTPEANGKALHVHHLVPYRFGGSNHPSNLAAVCDSCHHRMEAITEQILSSIPVEVSLDGSSLTITVDGVLRWHGSARGVGYPMEPGSDR